MKKLFNLILGLTFVFGWIPNISISLLNFQINASVNQSYKKTTTPLIGEVNINNFEWCYGWFANDSWESEKTVVVNDWSFFAWNWEEFINKYNNLSFDQTSFLQINGPLQTATNHNITIATNKIGTEQNQLVYSLNQENYGSVFTSHYFLYANLYMWHDNHSVYLRAYSQETSYFSFHNSTVSINLQSFSFEHQ